LNNFLIVDKVQTLFAREVLSTGKTYCKACSLLRK
jgi:hypothetical protein